MTALYTLKDGIKVEQTKTGETQRFIQGGVTTYRLDHIAIEAHDIETSVRWHAEVLGATCKYSDATWALLELLDGTKIALVTKGQHPPHIGIIPDADPFGDISAHRDGSFSFYQKDPHSTAVYEWIWYPKPQAADPEGLTP